MSSAPDTASAGEPIIVHGELSLAVAGLVVTGALLLRMRSRKGCGHGDA